MHGGLAEGLVAHIERVTVDSPLADDCPDAVFVEDAVVVFDNLAVITRPGADSRRGEIVEVDKLVTSMGLSINHIEAPGTLDGGDILKVVDVVYVGRGGRTNAEGLRQLRRILEPLARTVIAVPLNRVLHLKSAVTALPDGTVIGYLPAVDDPAFFPHFVPVPEESGAHVVCLGGDRLLTAADCPETIAMLEDRGYTVTAVDISKFQKLEGCVTCLSVRLRVPVL